MPQRSMPKPLPAGVPSLGTGRPRHRPGWRFGPHLLEVPAARRAPPAVGGRRTHPVRIRSAIRHPGSPTAPASGSSASVGRYWMAHRPAAQILPANHDGVERQELQEPVWADEQSRIVRDALAHLRGQDEIAQGLGNERGPGRHTSLEPGAAGAQAGPTCRGDHSVMT